MKQEEFNKKQSEMSNGELIERAKKEISELARTYGKSHRMCIPPMITDTDMILSEVVRRFEVCISNSNSISQGTLEKKENVWFIKWSDIHSTSNGTHWIWTPLHPTEIVDETKLKDGDEVKFKFVTTGYDEENFTPFSYVKLLE